jgi:dihydroneopterin aldolase
MNGRIQIRNMAFHGNHGCHPSERRQGQPFLVDLVLVADISRAAASDRLADTVDYAAAYAICRGIVEGRRVRLLETLCGRIIAAILRRFPRVTRVEVTIRKPAAPIAGLLDYVAVEASRDRRVRLPRSG